MSRVSQSQIAKQLGVAQITVSKALRGDKDISPKTQERVQRLAEQLGYVPNLLARSLIDGHTRTVGILLPQLRGKYFSGLLESLESNIRKNGFTPILMKISDNEDADNESLKLLIQQRVAGLIVFLGNPCWSPKMIDIIKRRKLPLVVIGKSVIPDICNVYCDDIKGVKMAVDWLVQQGHRRIAMLTRQYHGDPVADSRHNSFKEAIKDTKLSWKNDYIIAVAQQNDEYQAVKDFFVANPDVTALFCLGDELAFPAMAAIEALGLKIPGDISVMGYGGNVEYQEHMKIPLTTIAHDPAAIGKEATRLLVRQLGGEKVTGDFIFENHLIIRESTKRCIGASPSGNIPVKKELPIFALV
jgi:LacI family transcriptional regulator